MPKRLGGEARLGNSFASLFPFRELWVQPCAGCERTGPRRPNPFPRQDRAEALPAGPSESLDPVIPSQPTPRSPHGSSRQRPGPEPGASQLRPRTQRDVTASGRLPETLAGRLSPTRAPGRGTRPHFSSGARRGRPSCSYANAALTWPEGHSCRRSWGALGHPGESGALCAARSPPPAHGGASRD